MSVSPSSLPPPQAWLVRVPLVFSSLGNELFRDLQVASDKRLGRDYHLIQPASAEVLRSPSASLLMPWRMPVHHAWPCHPQGMTGFIEKAAQALHQKFGAEQLQTVLVGPLDAGPANAYYKQLASNLRGRIMQLFVNLSSASRDVENQRPDALTLFCFVGQEGLYAGVGAPHDCGGFYPGGTRFIKQDSPGSISRAGAKVAEALHHLRLHRPTLPPDCHWLELGASPGGMTSELLSRGWQVTAIDRAPLDSRLQGNPKLSFVRINVADYVPRGGLRFEAMLCDMNGPAKDSLREVTRLARHLVPGGIVIFTMKLPGVSSLAALLSLHDEIMAEVGASGLQPLASVHLTYNRQEFTLFFERPKLGAPARNQGAGSTAAPVPSRR